MDQAMMREHPVVRQRHELKRRVLTVREVGRVTPRMIRVVLEGESLADFVSLGADDHVKLIPPGGGAEPQRRDYTPRRFDPAARTLTLDFAVHEAGPATAWAVAARPGDRLEVAGPRGSMVVDPGFDWWLLVGDETALPAIGRWIEELPSGAPVTSLVAVAGPAEEQRFATAARHQPVWVHRPAAQAADPAPLLAAMGAVELPPGDGFVFVAGEAGVARAVRDLVLRRGHPAKWMKAAGYWKQGVADAHDKLEG